MACSLVTVNFEDFYHLQGVYHYHIFLLSDCDHILN